MEFFYNSIRKIFLINSIVFLKNVLFLRLMLFILIFLVVNLKIKLVYIYLNKTQNYKNLNIVKYFIFSYFVMYLFNHRKINKFDNSLLDYNFV